MLLVVVVFPSLVNEGNKIDFIIAVVDSLLLLLLLISIPLLDAVVVVVVVLVSVFG